MNLSSKIEALLFWKSEPIKIRELVSILGENKEKISEALGQLQTELKGRGITLLVSEEEVSLGTSKEHSSFIESIAKEELGKDLSKATLETLSIILYQGPISRSEIDYLRGVNSQFILRSLLIRGLIERVENETDQRIYLYRPTLALLAYLGINKVQDLPEYESVRKDIDYWKKTEQKNQNEEGKK